MHKEGFKLKKPCFTILRSRLCISVRIRILITDLISMIDIPCFSCEYVNSNQRQILRFNLNFTCLVSNYLIFSTISCPNFALPVGLFCLLVLTKYRKRSDEICHWYRHHQPLDHVSQLRARTRMNWCLGQTTADNTENLISIMPGCHAGHHRTSSQLSNSVQFHLVSKT